MIQMSQFILIQCRIVFFFVEEYAKQSQVEHNPNFILEKKSFPTSHELSLLMIGDYVLS